MKKKSAILMRTINILFFVLWLFSIVFPIERKTVYYENTDISSYGSLGSIPKIGAITNNRSAELRFSLYNETLYGICLYFYVDSDDDQGNINCTLTCDGKEIEKQIITVKELLALKKGNVINAKELILKNRSVCSGEYVLILEGENISPETRISLYGNRNAEKYLDYANADYQNYNGILYIIEVVEDQHPYIWATTFSLVMSLLFSYIIWIGYREKKIETAD